MQLNIKDEVSRLESVIIGIADNRGTTVHENNPKIAKHLKQGTLPSKSQLIMYVNSFAELIESQGIEVIRPRDIENQDQIFTRDISFVIDDVMVKSNMKKENRRVELQGIDFIHNQIPQNQILEMPEDSFIEGGDVILHGKYVFVGISERTNWSGYEFLRKSFPQKEVIPFQLCVTENPATNILHLDCAFQPVGLDSAIIYEGGFVYYPEAIYDIFGERNLIKVTQYEMYHMYPNVFSLAPDKVVSDASFVRLNDILRGKSIKVLETNYSEVGKLGGLFRCSTLPLSRK
jgi:N-dimethylarginine dimethylaminohydrolase